MWCAWLGCKFGIGGILVGGLGVFVADLVFPVGDPFWVGFGFGGFAGLRCRLVT